MRECDVRDKRVFISGPMSGIRHYNVGRFVDVHAMLKDMGATFVFDPAIEYLQYTGPERSHGEWVRVCLANLTNGAFDVLVSLRGWESSEGAAVEREVAEACGIAVFEIGETE